MNKPQVLLFALILCTISTLAQSGTPAVPAAAPSRINIDVLVTDKAGKPVAALEPTDFNLQDHNQPRRILGFRRTDGVSGSKFDPPVEVILVLDAVNLPYTAVTLQRLNLEKYLRQNGGHLAVPTSMFINSAHGLHVQPEPSTDGNMIAQALDKSTGLVSTTSSTWDVFAQVEHFRNGVATISDIAENEAHKPGRKILIWLGPGWPLLADSRVVESNEFREANFSSVVSLSKKLREARITVYSIYATVGVNGRGLYEAYLKPVLEARKTEPGHLALQVLVRETGGQVIDPGNDLAAQIAECTQDIGAYYTLTFAPPTALNKNEYHDLKIQVGQPGLTARTTSGYYNQP